MRPIRLLCFALVLGAVLAPGLGASGPPACTGSALTGTFRVVAGSAGAGNIVYALRLRNHSSSACFVKGIPGLRLLRANHTLLPTHVTPDVPGATGANVVLAPGKTAIATARFSPDIPGPGEPTSGPCEPKAHFVKVTPPPGGGTLVAPIQPPTSVCEHGGMQLRVLKHA